jgi:hypothetical protein
LPDLAVVINFAIECYNVIAVPERLVGKVTGIHYGKPAMAQRKISAMVYAFIVWTTVRYARIHAPDQ